MSYYGGLYRMTNVLRKFSFYSDAESTESLAAPLFREDDTADDMKNYGGIELSRLESNGANGSHTLGRRLERRRALIELRRIVIDVECLLALTGIVLMMIETELFICDYADKDDAISDVLKTFITLSTLLLLCGICINYNVDLRIKALDAGIREWQSVIHNSTIFCFVAEIIVCSVHPFPGDVTVTYTSPVGHSRQVSIDAILSILMMARLYLVAKFTVVHSRLVTDTSTNSIGALSKIKINTIFVFKAVMTNSPGKLLIAVMLTTFLVNSWAMRTCESYYFGNSGPNTYMEIMWLIATTFLTVGYGDKIPQSYCGRYISICTGVMGVGTTALMVAVLARKLEQSRLERYVFNMVTRIQIEKQRKNAAANVIKSLIHLWQIRKYSIADKALRRKYADSLKTSIRQLRIANAQKAHIDEFNVGIIEVSDTVNRISAGIEKLGTKQSCTDSRTVGLENRMVCIERKLDEIRTILVNR